MISKREKLYQAFGEFLGGFVTDLNNLSEDGWSVLIEGPRDARALRKLGFIGDLVTVSSVSRRGNSAFGGAKKIVILTDMDREGAVLAARFVKRLSHEGFKTSMRERLRLKTATRGMFRHIENLGRFSQDYG